jgi:hypothetical protein
MVLEIPLDSPPSRPAVAAPPGAHAVSRAWIVPLAAVAAFLVAKVFLIWRININWDEFYFLSYVHALVRGDLDLVFQTAFTHLFAWLPGIGGDESAQIIVARGVMLALLVLTVVLITRLALRWVPASVAWIAPLCFLASSPVLRHGGSFRADSMLAPLGVAALLLLTSRTTGAQARRAALAAGVCLGLAVAVSAKAVLVAPVAIAIVLGGASTGAPLQWQSLREPIRKLLLCGLVSAVVAGVALLLHRWSLPALPVETAQSFVGSGVRKTLIDAPFLPRWDALRITLSLDKATWILLAIGAGAAIHRRHWPVLACSLSLLPLLFYRNAYPYYYVVMLAPACVLAAFGADALRELASRGSIAARAGWIPVAVCLPLILQGAVGVSRLSRDEQSGQRDTIAAVHRVFPTPVPYIDHSGMIASFRKVNFFMSSWGVESYRARGVSFMRKAIAEHRPPLLLANRGELQPGMVQFTWLLPEDQELIQRFYVPYWGLIRVAGARFEVPADAPVTVALPFPGRYRFEAFGPMLIDGAERQPGEAVEIAGETCVVSLAAAASTPQPARLVWAAAVPAPADEPLPMQVYSGL